MKKMPILFVGHGSPMNAIEDNEYSKQWSELGNQITKPEAILAVSAHWYTHGIFTSDVSDPKLVYDMYGFPEELYQVKYDVKGSPEVADLTKDLIGDSVKVDNSWGIDHGAWSVLKHIYPNADIPVVQLSIDGNSSAASHYRLGQKIASLRESGVMILGSGNVVHNLGRVNWGMKGGYDWAMEFDNYIKSSILAGNHEDVIHYENAGASARPAFPTPEHFYPLLYVLGASDPEDKITVFNDSCTLGSMSMTGYLFE
ncbi:MAG: 4,5-DOPA dioxygenase extradiol [Clostridia bacterium]|nr:4,5-DOPA dioxygenase extradiol [Clostridia bacterium]